MNANQEYTASDYISALGRRRGALIAVALPILAGAVLLAVLLPDRYTSFAQIDINLEGSSARTLQPIEVTSYADQYIANLTDRALAPDSLQTLVNDPMIFPKGQDDLTESERLELVTNSLSVSVITQLVISPNSGREVDLITGFRVASVGAEPEFVFQVAKHAAELFLDADRRSRTERAGSESLFLSEQMAITESVILGLENDIANFKVTNACCLPELVTLNMSVIERAERNIADVRPRIRTLQKDRIFLLSQLEEIRQLTPTTDRLAELENNYMELVAKYGPNHPDVTRLRREITAIANADTSSNGASETVELRMRLIEAQQKYSDEHPDVIRYKQQIAVLEAQIRLQGGAGQDQLLENTRYIQVRGEINSIETELAELRRSEPALRQKIKDYENRLAETPQVESKYQALSRRLESARGNFDDLQRRAVIAQQSEALEFTEIGARVTQVLAANIPRLPSGPPRVAIVLLGVFLAGTLGIASMLFAEMTDSTVRSSKDIIRILNVVPLATVPVIENSVSVRQRQRMSYLIRTSVLVVTTAIILYYFKVLF